MKRVSLCAWLMLFFISSCQAQEHLTITIAGHEKLYSKKVLLAHPHLVLIKQVHLPTYPNRTFDLKAIPLCSLVESNKDAGCDSENKRLG